MKTIVALSLSVLAFNCSASAGTFPDGEANFKHVMQDLLAHYVDKNVTQEDLYRAATSGMLESLNHGEQTWNKLLSPAELEEIKGDLSGKVTGIGAGLKYDDNTGHAKIIQIMAHSPAEKAGLRVDDDILSVDGTKFKGQPFTKMVMALRGRAGASVDVRILREDQILTIHAKREAIAWTPVDLAKIDDSTRLLTIGYFTDETPKLVEDRLREVNSSHAKNLIVDLRDNSGGGFEQAVKVAAMFVPKDETVAIVQDRDHQTEKLRVGSGLLRGDLHVIIVTNKGTFCGAELLAATIKENRKAKQVGETTFGKWDAQSVETLPNGFAIKYTVSAFSSSEGHSYQDVGLKPDLEVAMPKDVEARDLRLRYDVQKRLALDPQLKAAVELVRAG